MGKNFILSLIFALIVGVFALSNGEKVVIDFIFTEVYISQALVIIISATLGAIIVFLLSLVKNLGLKKEIKLLKKERDEIFNEKLQLEEGLYLKKEELNELKSQGQGDLVTPLEDIKEENI